MKTLNELKAHFQNMSIEEIEAEFWEWCRRMKSEGHTIFISEYNAPADFVCVWQKEQTSSLTKDTGSKRAVEKLFTI